MFLDDVSESTRYVSLTLYLRLHFLNAEIDLCRVPTSKELLDISQRIFGQWKFVARYLDVGDTIDMISENARGDVKEQAYLMLSTWKERQGKDASVEHLCKSLVAVGLKSTAEKVFGYY